MSFQSSLIFMTSNLGAREMAKAVNDRFGFSGMTGNKTGDARLNGIGLSAVRRRFSPEFVNRIDRTITYRPLERSTIERILDLQLVALVLRA